jgi:predicted homoserine dehydrogenase-like protein
MTVEEARANRAVPVGLLESGKVLRPVRKGELLTSDNAAPDPTTRLFALRRLQDETLYGDLGSDRGA